MTFPPAKWRAATLVLLLTAASAGVRAQGPPQNGTKAADAEKKADDEPQLPFQIQLLETNIRFEANGDSRKEVHTVVKINNILGAHQFSRLSFDYNRSFQKVEIPLVRISHANGGTSELLPSATTDAAVEKFPAFQDIRVKSVRVLGLQDNDTIEYRVVTTTTHAPLAPDFSLEHTFDRSGQVLEEHYLLDVPGHVNATSTMAPEWKGPPPFLYSAIPATASRNEGDAPAERSIYEWKITASDKLPTSQPDAANVVPDLILSTFLNRAQLLDRIQANLPKRSDADRLKLEAFFKSKSSAAATPQSIYDAVSTKIATVDIPLGSDGFRVRPVPEILEAAYGTPLEKCFLLVSALQTISLTPEILLFAGPESKTEYPRPAAFEHAFVGISGKTKYTVLDPGLDVAPYGAIAAQFRGKSALKLSPHGEGDYVAPWVELPKDLPFHSFQKVSVDAVLKETGGLTAKVKYIMRGDNELLLRVAFHQSEQTKWKEIANLLAISDGFRGQVSSVNASNPLATKEPFTVEYEITQAKFVDWSKKPVRLPALLPQIGIPDPPVKSSPQSGAPKVELGTPLDVETHMTLRLPVGASALPPAGSAVSRDYATFESRYSAKLNILAAARHINFLERQLPADQTGDYIAFYRTVQNDQAQFFTVTVPPALAKPQPKTPPPEKQKSSP